VQKKSVYGGSLVGTSFIEVRLFLSMHILLTVAGASVTWLCMQI